jgi:protein-disulfide isomerase
MMVANPGKIRVSIRYAPFHNNSDYVVKVLEATHKQGKFWESLEALLIAQPNWAPNHSPQPDLVWAQLAGLGLDLDRIRQDMNTPEITQIVQQDIADAKTLKVTQTPEFFVNGKPMPSFGYEQLTALVNNAVATAYP